MLWTLFVVLLVLWLLGVVSSYTMGGFIHLLLILAVIALVFQLISGRRAAI
ncbi:MAG TPA: lmo0937 family membrane protein [Candidatus Angelobacter sp.]|nr:lmo0937 family membrane protein [Candidatus Angelobacter sp.]